jgi:hypothetical protein
LAGAAGDAHHAAALELGQLAHRLAHGAGGARDHHGLAGLRLAHVQQAEVGRHAGHAQHVEPLRERAQAQVDARQAAAAHLVGRHGPSIPARRGRR